MKLKLLSESGLYGDCLKPLSMDVPCLASRASPPVPRPSRASPLPCLAPPVPRPSRASPLPCLAPPVPSATAKPLPFASR